MNLNHIIESATKKVNKRFDVIEPNIYKNNAAQKPGSIGWLVGASTASNTIVKNLSRAALIAEEATNMIVEKYKLNLDQIMFSLADLNIQSTSLWRDCPVHKKTNPLVCYPGQYRSYSGHCNNVENPDWGCANLPYKRALVPRYGDGVSKIRRSITGSELPSARDVSLAVHQGHESPFSHITTMTSFLGQFIFHDLSSVAQSIGFNGQRIRCCGLMKAELIHPECHPIKITSNDPFMQRLNQKCMEYVRSSPTIRNRCSLGPREQINQVTSFLDGSTIYGSSKEKVLSLRSMKNGQLKSIKLSKKSKGLLPIQDGNHSHDCKMSGNNHKCFKSGDDRVNENLGLTIIHTLFMREHNRIARKLSALNPHWNDNEIFEEARKIVGAQIQHITYNEFLPNVLGEETVDNYGLRLLNDGYYRDYDMNFNPTIENAIANAVFYFLFTTMPSAMERYSKELHMIGFTKMTESFFNPSEMYTNKLDEYLMGMVSQNAKSSDPFVTDEMTNGLMNNNNDSKEAFDFVAFAIQRGRDHGLPGYVEYRRACQIEPLINRFEDLSTTMRNDVLKRLSNLYKNVRDIDLLTGGLAEKPVRGGLVGPTFACLLARQFNALRRGDRFWYENDMPPSSFSVEQLTEIRKSSLARIVCDNGDQTEFVQPSPMIASDIYLNAFQYCSTEIIPQINLDKWRTNKARLSAPLSIDDESIRKAIHRAKREIDSLYEREKTLLPSNNSGLSQAQKMHYNRGRRIKRQTFNNQSLILERATHGILKQIRNGRDREASNDVLDDIQNLVTSLPQHELGEYLKNQILIQNQNVIEQCQDYSLPCDHTSKYRTINGWCNNLHNPEYGTSMRLFNRFLLPVYEDGIGAPRKSSAKKNKNLPSPRLVSVVVHGDTHSPHVRYSLMTMQWGQFLDHDLTFTPMYLTSNGQLLNCKSCNSRKTVHPECWPITIPKNDPFFKNSKNHCLHFVRSMNAQKTLGPREQMNDLTSFIDGSQIYGSNYCDAHRLRTFRRGKLNTTRHAIRNMKDLLPQTIGNIECKAPSGFCFDAGDHRASEQPSLACIHTIIIREHNRIAEKLSQLNIHWDDERVYQETRKIISAFLQQITYREFLPRLLGRDYMTRFDINPLDSGYYNGYDDDCDATIKNEFSAAVFRLGHTLLKPSFERLDVNYQPIKQPMKLREGFFNSDMLYEPFATDELLRGLVTSSIEKFDNSITEEITNHLFEDLKKPFSGMDLISLNLQRARDHGIPSYNQYRRLCNMTVAKNFEDLSNEIPMPVIKKLKLVYEHVDDIDLFTGGIAENSLHGALVGPTIGCLLGLQFRSLRKCDRFWYENANVFTRFTSEQLAEIRKVTLSKIICTNSDQILHIQKQSMDLHDLFLNPRLPCTSLPEMDLNKWRTNDKHCMIGGQMILLGRYGRLSPCVNCLCSVEGSICQSIRVENCQDLTTSFTVQQILADQSCVVQCAYSIRNNQQQQLQTSTRTFMSMLHLNF
nr:uncharacterized protein LOC124492873 isoform X1 [Dermatophagoides farinae]XP_046911838.1 uncharacterized protein LOC124492873 isoform X1 [Dermatophagoides farinae]